MPTVDWLIAKERQLFREEGLEPLFVQMSANMAVTAGTTGDLHGLGSIGSAIRAIHRGVLLRVVSVSLRRPIFWLMVRPEFRTVKELKGKLLGTATIGGSQHTAARRLLSAGGLDPDKDVTTDDEIREHLVLDAQILKLPEPIVPAKVFDFALQREVNKELGIR